MGARLSHLLLSAALILVAAGVLAWGPLPAAAQGIGIYPTQMNFSDAARGGEYFRTVGVINSGDSDTVFTLEGEGPISDWISFVDAGDRSNVLESITIAGKSESQTLLKITVPPDAANGQYQGSAQVVARAGGTSGDGGSSVGVGAAIDVNVDVSGEQRFQGSLMDSSVSDVESGHQLRLRARVRNSGNVRITPQVALEVVDSEGNMVYQETFQEELTVYPNETGELSQEVGLPTRDLGEGQYQARVSATTGDLDLGQRESSFSIMPVGALTREGQLRDLRMAIAPQPGELGKLDVVFLNTGRIDTLARFVGELYHGDRLVEVLNTEEVLVPIREQRTLDLFFRAEEAGDYRIRGKVNYQGKETETRELAFTVTEEGAAVVTASSPAVGGGGSPADQPFWTPLLSALQDSPFYSTMGIVVAALGLLILVLLVLLVRRRSSSYRW